MAVSYLKKQGYKILEQNYLGNLGEIDIIARDGDYLCFIEVKNRASDEKGSPLEAITKSKIRKISQNALWYLKNKGIPDCDMRFDVVGITECEYSGENEIELIKNAFELSEPYF